MNDYEIRLSGSGGQGLILAARILADALVLEGKQVAQSQSYEPTSRGGLSRSDLVINEGEIDFPLTTSLDFLLILDEIAITPSIPMIKTGGLLLLDSTTIRSTPKGDFKSYTLPLSAIARQLGNPKAANIVSLGAIQALVDLCGFDALQDSIRQHSPKRFLDTNLAAANKGHELIGELLPADTDSLYVYSRSRNVQ